MRWGLTFEVSGPSLVDSWLHFVSLAVQLQLSGGAAPFFIAFGCHSDASRHHFEFSWTWLATRMLDDAGMLSAGTVVSLQLDCSNYVHPSP